MERQAYFPISVLFLKLLDMDLRQKRHVAPVYNSPVIVFDSTIICRGIPFMACWIVMGDKC